MTNIVHSLPYPSLDDGNMSFPTSIYKVDVISLKGGASIQLTHHLENAGLIKKLLENGEAKYGCLLSVPLTGHRRLNLSTESVHTVGWDLGVVGEPPIIRPIIVATETLEYELDGEDDVADIWIGKKVKIPKGARLARGKYLRSISSLQSILDPKEDENLPDGCFVVEPNENDGFRFKVNVASDVFNFLSHSTADGALYRSIGVHMVSRCFTILKEEQGFDGEYEKWNDHTNLRMLSGLLEEKSLPHWSEDDFKPEKVALQLHPLILPRNIQEE